MAWCASWRRCRSMSSRTTTCEWRPAASPPSLCLEMTDDRWWRNRVWAGTKLKKVPSDYFRDHWLATFIVDPSGVAVRHLVGVDNMAWSTDFPHHGNDWPYSRRVIDSLFAEVPEEERRKIVCTNAARFWGLTS